MSAQQEHPARAAMLELGRQIPSLWDALARARQESSLPAHIYLTDRIASRAAFYAVRIDHGDEEIERIAALTAQSPLQAILFGSSCATLAAWRMTQGIYRIDPMLYSALNDTDLSGDIPAEVLRTMPEWCVYIETPGFLAPSSNGLREIPIDGFWARIDQPENARHEQLVIAMRDAADRPLAHHYLPLVGSLHDALRTHTAETPGDKAAAYAQRAMQYLPQLVNLLLFVCAGDDISGRRGAPSNPSMTRTKRGPRLFPAPAPTTWDVGVRIGAALRRAYQAMESRDGSGTHTTVRPHIRRAHWHGFRSGARKRADGSDIPAHERRFNLRWLPPIPVNVEDIDALPAVIRSVQ